MIDTSDSIDWSARDHQIWMQSKYHSVPLLAHLHGLTEKEIREILATQIRKIGAS